MVALGAGALALIVTAALLVGPPEQAASVQSRIVKVQEGVVQSTVSGSGNIQAATQLNLGFKTAGMVQRIYVTQGEYVTAGKLLAELNPQSAEVTLEQAKAVLQAAEATLVQEEESGGETSSGQSSGSSAAGTKTTASTAVATTATAQTRTVALTATTPATTAPTRSISGSAPTSTSKAPTTSTSKAPTTSTSKAPTTSTSKAPTTSTSRTTTTSTGSTPSTHGSSGSTAAPEKPAQSPAIREANLASARASVKSDKLAVQGDEQSVANSKLYAPDNGTIVSLSGEVGESVSGSGTSKASSSASSSSTTAAGSAGTGGGSSSGRSSGAGASSASSASSTGSASSSSAFAVLSDLGTMQLAVPLSESEVVHVHVGQPATVTVEALEGLKLAAHVVSVATLSTSNSGVVSYPVTFQLDQAASALKPGMSASAEVVVKQAEGVNVPTNAISGKAVTVVRGGKRVRQAVVTGLAGSSSTIILSGVKAGEEIVLPIASTSGGASIVSKLAGRGGGALGGGGLGGGAFPGGARGGG
jgi:multidrug resistance efflux pump